MAAQRILVVDDEESILKVVEYALTDAGFDVHTAADAATGEKMLAAVDPALVILDVMLPGKSGLDIARDIRMRSDVPIIMLSARTEEVDRILGLEIGADDYVTKPFSPRELVSRVRAILKRCGAIRSGQSTIVVGDMVVDTPSRQVYMGDALVPLTKSEYDILHHLAKSPGTTYSRDAIMTALWDEEPVGDERAIDVHVHNIREKLEPDPKNPEYVITVRGFGYRLRRP